MKTERNSQSATGKLAIFVMLLLIGSILIGSCKKDEIAKNEKKEILSFSLTEQTDSAVIDNSNKTVKVTVKYNADLTKQSPQITISEKADIVPASGQMVDFSKGTVTYTVTAEDATTQKWIVTVIKADEIEKKILTFTLADQVSNAVIDNSNKTVAVTVKYNADLTKQSPQITISDKTKIVPASGQVVDFSQGAITYTITADDSSKQNWIVTVTKAPEMEKKILTFVIADQVGAAEIDNVNDSVKVTVSAEADLTKLKPEITVSDGTTINPASGEEVDFSKGLVKYTITASDGSTKTILVTVTRVISSEKAILNVSIPGQIGEAVFGTNNNITVYFPYGTDFTSLVPEIAISKNATISPLPGVPTDFSKGYVQYTLTAEDGKIAKYKIYADLILIEADNSNIQYVGRMDYSTSKHVKFSAAGAYIKAKFSGTYLDIVMSDASNQNYIEVLIDDQKPIRLLMLTGKKTYNVAKGLNDGEHTILICKDTEASIGSLDFWGFHCDKLLPTTELPTRKIECFGNSITVGANILVGEPCDLVANGTNWNAANCAYLSYGAVTARALNAQYHITAWSGIGMISSCCGMTVTMPDVYDRVYLDQPKPKWDFAQYVPDVVTICLGQNDGSAKVASQEYKDKYVAFINSLRSKYPNASIFCVTSPMADNNLLNVMNTSLQGIVDQFNTNGDIKVYKVELPHNLHGGCTANPHPNEAEHAQVAEVLTTTIREKMGW